MSYDPPDIPELKNRWVLCMWSGAYLDDVEYFAQRPTREDVLDYADAMGNKHAIQAFRRKFSDYDPQKLTDKHPFVREFYTTSEGTRHCVTIEWMPCRVVYKYQNFPTAPHEINKGRKT